MAKKAGQKKVSGGREVPRKQYCPTHEVECRGVMVMPKRRMVYKCPEGCELTKAQVVLR